MVNEKKWFLPVFFSMFLPSFVCLAGEPVPANSAYLSLIEGVECLQGVNLAIPAAHVPGPLILTPGMSGRDASVGIVEPGGLSRTSENKLGELYEHTWGDLDFLWYFVFGNGKAVNLSDIGLLDAVQNSKSAQNTKERFGLQILSKIKSLLPVSGTTDISDTFTRSYDFKDVVFSIGDATLAGTFKGKIWRNERHGHVFYTYRGEAEINFVDRFTDPGDVVEILYGHSKPPDWVEQTGNAFVGTAYDITGSWKWTYSGPSLSQ